ncbi:MAG TPA: hypothetical protein VNV85_01660 [Puia sp.]|jgi:hypothetical protein|nr:hypothetical protein [Puia sp.]
MKIKILLFATLFAVCFFSCKKVIQQQEQNAVLNIITSGVWYVQTYTQDSIDITASFSGYVFKFNQNGTVIGTKDSVATPGTWSASISDRTITSNFPNPPNPLNKLNSVWKITDSGLSYVVANATINDSTENIRLQKQ